MHELMQQCEEQLSQEMTWLLQELEQRSQEQSSQEHSGFAWGAMLFAAFKLWQFWAIAGVVVLLFGLCWWLRKRSHEPDGSSSREQVEEEDDSNDDDANDLGRFFEEHIQWPVQNLATDCLIVKDLVGLLVFRALLSKSFFPVLQPAIRVGSALKGWSPHEKDIIYRLLVPLKPHRWHAFHLELGTAGAMPAKDFRICMEQECTCMSECLVGYMLCFLHHPKEELRRNQNHSLLGTLCTSSCLDVQKTGRWFHQLVKAAWVLLPQLSNCCLTMLSSSHSCKFQVTKGNKKSLIIEMTFRVQQGNLDIVVSSQSTEAIITPSMTWPESYTIAEVKFFRHMARQVPCDTFHLKCLQLCTHILVGTGFSTYTLKTVVMHLLNTLHSLSGWNRRDFLLQLQDIMQHLRKLPGGEMPPPFL
ncbi:LOW QUALITY PROTEIN: inositol 1,4,5-trisphosphate receptor-interacting protein-like 1 [Pluvialis apricaria]